MDEIKISELKNKVDNQQTPNIPPENNLPNESIVPIPRKHISKLFVWGSVFLLIAGLAYFFGRGLFVGSKEDAVKTVLETKDLPKINIEDPAVQKGALLSGMKKITPDSLETLNSEKITTPEELAFFIPPNDQTEFSVTAITYKDGTTGYQAQAEIKSGLLEYFKKIENLQSIYKAGWILGVNKRAENFAVLDYSKGEDSVRFEMEQKNNTENILFVTIKYVNK